MPCSKLSSKSLITFVSIGVDSGNDPSRWLEFSIGNGIGDLCAELSSFHDPNAVPPLIGHQLNLSAIGNLRLFFEQPDGTYLEDPDYQHRVEFHQHHEPGPPARTSIWRQPARISGMRWPILDAPPFAGRPRRARVFIDLLRGSHDYDLSDPAELWKVVYASIHAITVEP